MAVVIGTNLRKEIAGLAAVRRSLVQGRAARPAVPVRPERGREDDPAPDPGRRNRPARRRARLREGGADRAARPASAARARAVAARVRALRRGRPDRDRAGAHAARSRDGRRRARSGDAPPLLGGAGPARARRRLRLAGARRRGPARARLRGRRPRPRAGHVLRRRADARLARARPRRRSRPAPPGRADQPPRRQQHRVARADAPVDRRRRHPGRARPLVPGGDDDGRPRAGGRPLDVLRRALARVAPREGRAAARRVEGRRPRRPRHRAPRPLRRALPRVEPEDGAQGAGEADPHRPAREGAGEGAERDPAPDAQGAAPRLRVPQPRPQRPDGGRGGGSRRLRRGPPSPGRDLRARARRARRPRRPERLRQDDAARDHARPARTPWRQGAPRSRRRGGVLLPAGGGARRARVGARLRPGGYRAPQTGRAEPARSLPLLGLGGAAEGRSRCSPAASEDGWRSRSSSRRGPTSSSSTSPRTTSTWRAARRSRPRSRPFPGRSCSSRTTAPCWMPWPSARWPSRTAGWAPTTAAGPITSGGAPSSTPRRSRSSRSLAKAKAKPAPKPKPPQPSELERIESEIEARERTVAELEQKLSDDWTDVETLSAHRRAREELQSLISRWEEVFERR